MITEPDVTLTDYGLAIECALFTYLLYRRGGRPQPLRTWFAVFFGSASVASLTGGTVHGFFLDVKTVGYAILWPATLVAIGVTALSTWAIGARIQFSAGVARGISIGAAVGFAGYCVVVLFVAQTFRIAVLNYLPAAIFLLGVLTIAYARVREREVLVGMGGLVLIFVAAGVQQGGVALHPVYFNHNALFHLIQAVALFMLFWGARCFVGTGIPE
ncbi:MAG: DUF6962 family protein [Candidatus Methylomirabilales bacterium]